MLGDPHFEATDDEEDFPAPPPQVVRPAVPSHSGYEVRYDSYTGQPYHHGDPSSGFYLPPGPSESAAGNQNNGDPREYAELLTEDNTPTNEMEQYRSAQQLNQLYPELPANGSSERQNENRSPTDAQVRDWGATSPIAERIRRVLSDGSFARGEASETNGLWNFGVSPPDMGRNVPGTVAQMQSSEHQHMTQHPSDPQNLLVFPGVSAAISSKIDMLAETVKGLVATMYDVVGKVNDIQSSSRPSSVTSIPERLQPRQTQRTVDPVHKQRLQQVLANVPRKQVQINTVPQTVSITPQTGLASSRIHYPPFPVTDRRPELPRLGFTTEPRMPMASQPGAVQMPIATHMVPDAYPSAASFIAPMTGHKYYFPPVAGASERHIEQEFTLPHAQSISRAGPPQQTYEAFVYGPAPVLPAQDVQLGSRAQGREVNQPAVSDYKRSEYAQIGSRAAMIEGPQSSGTLPATISGTHPSATVQNIATEGSLMQLLLFSTVSQQIKKLSGRDGLEKAKDYFREFEGLTRAWDDRQRIDLLGMKVIDSARLAFESYEKDATRPLFSDAKKAILDALSVEDNRKVGAWTELKNLQQAEKESITEFGTRVKQTVRDAMGHMQSSSQLEELNKKYFIDGLRDIGIRRSLAAQQERSRYVDLIRDGALIERSCPEDKTKEQHAPYANRQSGTYQGNGGYTSGYNGTRRTYQNSGQGNNGGQQAYKQRQYVPAKQNSGFGHQNNGYRQSNESYQRQNSQNNNGQRTYAPNSSQLPNLTGGNAARQAQNFQFPRSPNWQGAANTGSASQ